MTNDKIQMTNESLKSKSKQKYFQIGIFPIHWDFVIGILLFIVAVGGFGCARTVTSPVTYGTQMAVEVVLRGNMDVNANRYFLVVSSNSNFKVALPYPDINQNAPEFLEPDLVPQLGTAEAYYTYFYSTWSGFVELDPGGYFLTKGPFVITQTTTREPLATLEDSDNKLNFIFRLDRMFGSTVPNQIYFDFISVPWPSGQAKIPADHLTLTNSYISSVYGSVQTVTDGQDTSLNAAVDIVSLKAEMQ